jgi:membrane protein DedA with SNARE-associated domain
VRRHDTLMVLAIRFSPGLRIALAAACAYANVPPLKFSLLNLLSSVVWAGVLLGLIAWVGPRWLPDLGISGWWAAIVPALLLIVIFRSIALAEKRTLGKP